ncbi:YwmB family TATA-box binding protein [Clostridium botulinum]|uniref:TATA-box binding n=1 Tax=Clostridium botulinum TaxID=1491 RepID=A0A9Q1UVY1_CLOBO|nr:YwmB family TATA-box binding protein [Clostridium botulinum]KEH98360.1 hypothetical protein Z953_00205 [Clostridium botulinum D str. 16868]KEI05101.1 hypothetical protein Y848_09990 [Clostridium botulinum C/D str. Sp77]KLU75375.1 hypothetical protein CBC3_08840 [Clostridium botulinum V891]KOA76231.1 hypothetical protein ADU78_06315 [Clostridium botulinum]KOA80008.1 hypothetical protein ADU77_02055 [Clostridium botulinum]
MKNIKKGVVFFITVVSIFLNYKITYAYKNIDYFEKFINTTGSKVIEYGVNTKFETTINGQELFSCFKDRIPIIGYLKLNTYENKGNYHMEFKNSNIKGYILIQSLKEKSYVTINIIKTDNTNKLSKLQSQVRELKEGLSKKEGIYYQYLKAKLPDNDLSKVNNNLISLLKNTGAINVDSVEINDGFSTCAYTTQYEPKRNNGKLMDLNYALSNYSSGAYITIATPEIITTY